MRAFQNDTHRPHWTTRTEDTAVYVILNGGGCGDSKSEEWCRFAESQKETQRTRRRFNT